MKLMTKEIKETLTGFHDNKDLYESPILVKYFDPFTGAKWIITEGEVQDDGDILFFGYCYITFGEWGYVRLSDLLSLGGRIERDLHVNGDLVRDEFKRNGWKIPT